MSLGEYWAGEGGRELREGKRKEGSLFALSLHRAEMCKGVSLALFTTSHLPNRS